jgi:predicted peroxiredoxin
MLKESLHKIKKRPVQYFCLRLLILFMILFVIDYSLGSVLRYMYFKQESGELYRITYCVEKTNEDILVFGSSRANHHYHPEVFEKRLNLSFYNTGLDGEHILYQAAILKGVLKRYTPKIIIFDFVEAEFGKNPASYDRLSSLLPYYNDHPEIRAILKLKSPYEKYKLLSKAYPYNSEIFQIVLGNTGYKKAKHEDIKGYIPRTETWDVPIKPMVYPEQYPLDSNKIKIFESIIKDCISAGTKLYVICSPYFFDAKNQEYSIRLGKEIAKKYNIDFFDFSNNSAFTKNANLFADFAHLNDTGAKVFSEMLIDSLVKKDERFINKFVQR